MKQQYKTTSKRTRGLDQMPDPVSPPGERWTLRGGNHCPDPDTGEIVHSWFWQKNDDESDQAEGVGEILTQA